MRNIVRRVADRMVDVVAPHAEAQAYPCTWGRYCYCRSDTAYFRYCCDPAGYSCYCKARYHAYPGC